MKQDRRRFLQGAAGLSAAAAFAQQPAAPAVDLPRIKFREHELTRLIVGSNPFYGYSHFNSVLDKCMREYYTPEKQVEVLLQAEKTGLNTWQVHYNDPTIAQWKAYRAAGGKMKVLLLADFALMKDWSLLKDVAKLGPIGIGHHGNRTDERFREGKMNIVRDFINAVHDAGVPAGVSCHNPAVVEYVEEHGWPVDYYMTCMYRVSRTVEETRAEFGGEAALGEAFMERDPERMCNVVRKTRKTCFAFKVLGGGRNLNKVEESFRFVLKNIKPQDPVIVGIFPKFKDELREDAEIVKKVCAEG